MITTTLAAFSLLATVSASSSRHLDSTTVECPGIDIVETTTDIFLTLAQPFDQVTAAQRDALTAACVAEYNAASLDPTLKYCAPDTTLAVECSLQEYVPTSSSNNEIPSLPQAIMRLAGHSTLSDNAWFEYETQPGDSRRVRDHDDNDHRQLNLQTAEFCACQNTTNPASPGIDFEPYMTRVAAATANSDGTKWVLDGQQVTQVNCGQGEVFNYDGEFYVTEDASQWTTDVITEFEQLFHGECNRWSVQECDPQNFVVLSTTIDKSSIEPVTEQPTTRHLKDQRQLQDFPSFSSKFKVSIWTTQHNGPFRPDAPELFEGDVRRRVQSVLDKQQWQGGGRKGGIVLSHLKGSSKLMSPVPQYDRHRRRLAQVGDTVDYPCYCDIRRAPDGVPILQEEVTYQEVNQGLDRLFGNTAFLFSADEVKGEDPTSGTPTKGWQLGMVGATSLLAALVIGVLA